MLLCCLVALGIKAQGVTRVKDYCVGIVVHENNMLEVWEDVSLHFAEPRHGFYRYVPYEYYIGDKKHMCDISGVEVEGDMCDLSKENSNLLIRIGNPDKTLTGDKDYALYYQIQNNDDRNPESDIFKHSVLGNDFDLPIDTLRFTIVFEKPLQADVAQKMEVYSGGVGNKTNALNADVWMSGDTIYGIAANIKEKQALTVMLPLEEGYYVGEPGPDPTLAYILFGVVMVIVAVMLYFELTRRHIHVTKTIEFYPPEGLCSAEVGTIIDDSVDNVDIASLIPWYASEGYVKIEEKVEDRLILGDKKYLEITKLKPASAGWKKYQRTFFNTLFKEGDAVRLDKLPKAEEGMKKVHDELESEFSGETTLTKWHWSAYIYVLLVIASSLFMVSTLPYGLFEGDDWYVFVSTWGIPMIMGAKFVITFAAKYSFEGGRKRLYGVLFSAVCMIIVMNIQLWMMNDLQVPTWMVQCVFVACYIVTELLSRLNIDTPYRAQLMGKLQGLEEFIRTAEEPRLKSLLEDDPQYFYRIFPYAMVFEISDKWADLFKNIEMEKPDWYKSTSPVSDGAFIHGFAKNLSSASDSAISCMSPSSSSGGGAGGGTGGGGGGAW